MTSCHTPEDTGPGRAALRLATGRSGAVLAEPTT
jgi:hypothetical protein